MHLCCISETHEHLFEAHRRDSSIEEVAVEFNEKAFEIREIVDFLSEECSKINERFRVTVSLTLLTEIISNIPHECGWIMILL